MFEATENIVNQTRGQWIVWLEGSHLPSEIEVHDPSGKVTLAR